MNTTDKIKQLVALSAELDNHMHNLIDKYLQDHSVQYRCIYHWSIDEDQVVAYGEDGACGCYHHIREYIPIEYFLED